MIAKITELLGGDEEALYIARMLTHAEMWLTKHELKWLYVQVESVVKKAKELRRRAA